MHGNLKQKLKKNIYIRGRGQDSNLRPSPLKYGSEPLHHHHSFYYEASAIGFNHAQRNMPSNKKKKERKGGAGIEPATSPPKVRVHNHCTIHLLLL
jgi:hypothetical protein